MGLTFSGKQDVYLEIVQRYENYIRRGVLKNGEKLPSVRTYAVDRRVNPNTVAKAYAALEADGYLRVQPKQGAFVCYGAEAQTENIEQDEIKKQISVWKQTGITKEEIERVLAQVYGGELV